MLEGLSHYHIDNSWAIHLYADLDCGKISVQPGPRMATETFGRYIQRYPGVFAFVGIRNEALGAGAAHHNPRFDMDESTLVKAVECSAAFAAEVLTGKICG